MDIIKSVYLFPLSSRWRIRLLIKFALLPNSIMKYDFFDPTHALGAFYVFETFCHPLFCEC